MTLKMTTAQVVETSVTVTNSSFQNYTHHYSDSDDKVVGDSDCDGNVIGDMIVIVMIKLLAIVIVMVMLLVIW